MDKTLYTIGLSVPDEKYGIITKGIYAFGSFGLPYILTDFKKVSDDKSFIYVIEGHEDAEKVVQQLSRIYRYEFRNRAKKYGKSMNEYHFYPLKLDKKYFNGIKFGNKTYNPTHSLSSKKYQFTGNKQNIILKNIEKIS